MLRLEVSRIDRGILVEVATRGGEEVATYDFAKFPPESRREIKNFRSTWRGVRGIPLQIRQKILLMSYFKTFEVNLQRVNVKIKWIRKLNYTQFF